MSHPGTIAAPQVPHTFLSTLEADLKRAGQWILSEGEGVALTLWAILKVGLVTLTKDQAQVAVNVLTRLDTDAMAGKSIEEIESDMLNEAVSEEIAILKTVASATLQAIIAAFKASNA